MKRFIQTILMLWISANVLGQDIRQAKVEQFEVRLNSHADVFRDWVHDRLDLTVEQNAEFEKLILTELQRVSIQRNETSSHEVASASAGIKQIRFTTQPNVNNFISSAWLTTFVPGLLNDQQQARWLKVTSERQEWIRTANLGYLVEVVDDFVFLSDRQRVTVAESIRQMTDNDRSKQKELEIGLFRFQVQKSILPQAKLYRFLSGPPRDILSAGQKLILDSYGPRIRMGGGRYTARIPTPVSDDDDTRMRKAFAAFREKHRVNFATSVNERVSALDAAFSLTESQKRHLFVAGKGVTKQCLARWQAAKFEELRQMGQRIRRLAKVGVGSMEMNVQGVSVRALDHEPIWRGAVTEITAKANTRRNLPIHRRAVVGYVTAMLDKELWLRPEQRDPLSALIDDSFPPLKNVEQADVKELELLVIPLFCIPDDRLKTVLSVSQRTAWTVLMAQFKRRGDHVILPLEDGSEVSFDVSR